MCQFSWRGFKFCRDKHLGPNQRGCKTKTHMPIWHEVWSSVRAQSKQLTAILAPFSHSDHWTERVRRHASRAGQLDSVLAFSASLSVLGAMRISRPILVVQISH